MNPKAKLGASDRVSILSAWNIAARLPAGK